MDKVRDYLAVACLAYSQGDAEFAIRSFLQGMDEARANGEQGLQQVVEFLRAPVAQRVTDVPAAENTMAPSLHSDEVGNNGVTNSLDADKPVDPQPVIAPIPEPVPSTITSLSNMVDDGDEELEARAEAEDEIDEDDLDDEEDDEDESDEDEEEEEGGMQLSISSATPLRLKKG